MSLADDLRHHVPADEAEAGHLAVIAAFVGQHPRPFDRAITEGHLTASAVVVSHDHARVLLVHHRGLERWLQPGGHGEPGETTGQQVALREATEETGIAGLRLHPGAERLLDVDVHRIPAKVDVAAHDHLDLRYLVQAPPGATIARCDEETRAAAWFTWDELAGLRLDPATVRMFAKARAVGVHVAPPAPQA